VLFTLSCFGLPQLYELAASGVRERARLRQELSEMQQEMQGTKRQLHAFMASLMQLKSSMDSAGDGDVDHALEMLQSSSWTQSLQGEWCSCYHAAWCVSIVLRRMFLVAGLHSVCFGWHSGMLWTMLMTLACAAVLCNLREFCVCCSALCICPYVCPE
jgi:hypothetical protein